MSNVETSEIAKNIVIMATSMGAFLVALAGLTAWRRQLKGKEQYDLARRYLLAVYKFREALANVRYPAIWGGEMSAAIKVNEGNKDFNPKDADKAVYTIRWRKVDEANSALEVELLEAEVLWGKEAKEIVGDLFKCRNRLFLTVRRYIEDRTKNDDDDILYDSFENDPFNRDVDAAIAKVEVYLRKHLK